MSGSRDSPAGRRSSRVLCYYAASIASLRAVQKQYTLSGPTLKALEEDPRALPDYMSRMDIASKITETVIPWPRRPTRKLPGGAKRQRGM